MARIAALTARLSLGLLVMISAAAAAQAYPQLHVIALAQRSDRSTVEPSGVFHVTIHVKIAQHRDRLDELILGSFENCEITSNETVRRAVPDGTDFIERLTVQALTPGDATISPAYIDAVDPVLGKPMRYSSNAIRVHVTGSTPIEGALRTFGEKARRLLLAAAIVAGLLAAAFVPIVVFARRKRRPANVAPARSTAATVAAPIVPNEGLIAVAQAYGRERSEVSLAQVRALLFDLAGAASGATLVDALCALGERDGPLRAALLAAEGAAFGPAADRCAAGDAMLAAIQAYCERRPANEDVWIR